MATSTPGMSLSASAASSREAARRRDGKFGEQVRAEDDGVDLMAGIPAPTERAFADASEVFTTRYESVEAKLEAFKGELDSAVEALGTDENWLAYCDMASKFHRYSFSNQMLIHLQTGGRATRVAGFRSWRDNFGRTVNTGEKAIGILAPKIVNVTEKDASGNPKKGPDGKPIKTRRLVGFTTAAVFDVAQTSGDPLPEIEQELSEEPPEGFVEDMTAAAEAAGYSVEFRKMDSHAAGTAQGWTDPKGKKIVVDASLSPGSQAATLAHELGHVYAGHAEPENEGKYHVGEGGCRGRFEVEAESVAYILGRSQGMAMSDGKLSAQYVAGWSRHDKDALRDSAEAVSKAAKRALESAPFRNTVHEG